MKIDILNRKIDKICITYPHNLKICIDCEDFKIIVDSMLGKLAQWLRMLGVKTEFFNIIDDRALLSITDIVITRDVELFKCRVRKKLKSILITCDDFDIQLTFILDVLDRIPDTIPVPKYCTSCGGSLKLVDVSKVLNKIPRSVASRFRYVWECTRCGKVYWIGSHHAKIRDRINKLLNMKCSVDRIVTSILDRVCMIRLL